MSTTPQPRLPTTESPESQPITTPIEESERGAAATFDADCRRRLGCLFDVENSSISPAHTTQER